MQLVHFRSFLCFELVAAMFGDGGSGVDSIFRIVKALCIKRNNTALVQNVCTTLESNLLKVKWEKVIMKGNIAVKYASAKYCVLTVRARKHL